MSAEDPFRGLDFDPFPRATKVFRGLRHLVDSFILPREVDLSLSTHRHDTLATPITPVTDWPLMESDGIVVPLRPDGPEAA